MALQSWSLKELDLLSLRYAPSQWTREGTTNEYWWSASILSKKPWEVLLGGTVVDEGAVGSLTARTWGWDSGNNRLYVRLSDNTNPDTKDEHFVSANTGLATTLLDSGTSTVILLSLLISNPTNKSAQIIVKTTDFDDEDKFVFILDLNAGDSPFALDTKLVVHGGDKVKILSDNYKINVYASGDIS